MQNTQADYFFLFFFLGVMKPQDSRTQDSRTHVPYLTKCGEGGAGGGGEGGEGDNKDGKGGGEGGKISSQLQAFLNSQPTSSNGGAPRDDTENLPGKWAKDF